MKDKGWFAKKIYRKRRIYTVLFLAYVLLILGIFVFYNNMSGRVYVTKGVPDGDKASNLAISAERSKEWTETSTAGFDKGMEYDFVIVNAGGGDVREWVAEIDFTQNFAIDSSWNGDYEKSEQTLIVRPDNKTAAIPSEEERTFGLVMISLDEQSVSEYRLFYKVNYQVTDSPLFWIVLAAAIITMTVFLTDEVNFRRYSELRKWQEEIQAILLESFTTFANIIDAKDPYTQGHSLRVAEYARLIAARMGYSDIDQERVYWIGMLHDIGKIGITDVILQKPGQLDNSEYSTIKTHVDIGGLILKDFKALPHIADGAQYHHERWDGKGYSENLEGKDIPEIARIICIADSFDAMTSPRVYRKAMSLEFARNELEKCAGTQFDPEIVPIMLRLIDDGLVPVEL